MIAIGKTREEWLRKGLNVYLERVPHYIPFEYIELPDLKKLQNKTTDEIRESESVEIMKYCPDDAFLIALDEHGNEFTSEGLSVYLQKKSNAGLRYLTFLIGGAYGLSDSILKKCQDKISLSKLTFSHQMVRLIFLEQLFRAFTILRNEPYHHK